MSKIAVFKKPDGSLSYRTPVWPMLENETEQEYFDRTEARERQTGAVKTDWTRVAILDVSELPLHYGFLGAMTFTTKIECDMARARAIHRQRMREARKPKLEALDILWMRGVAKNDLAKADSAENQREQLRNVTADPAIDAAATPEALKVVWPAILT